MNQTQASLAMVALFALRCVAPVVLTMALCYAMNRLVDHWQAQEAERQALLPHSLPDREKAAAAGPAILSLPCWVMNNCPEEIVKNCAAFKNRNVPCWQARLEEQGFLPANCTDCPRYAAAHAMA